MLKHILIAGIVAAAAVAVRAEGQQPRVSGPWQVDFGAKPLPEPPAVQPMHRGHSARVFNVPGLVPRVLNMAGVEGSFLRGLKTIPLTVEKPRPAGDCAMVKPADPKIDPAFVRSVHGHVKHSLVIVPVTPCK